MIFSVVLVGEVEVVLGVSPPVSPTSFVEAKAGRSVEVLMEASIALVSKLISILIIEAPIRRS